MAINRCDVTVIQGRLIAIVNAAPAGTWATTISSSDDARRNTTEITKIALAADADVCVWIAETLGHGYRSLFLSDSADIAHGGVIPDHLGPVEQIRIKHATGDAFRAGRTDKWLTLADIENWRDNPSGVYGATAHNASGSPLSGYYLQMGSQLFFTGDAARAQIANVTRTSSCQAPDNYEDAVVARGALLLPKEGDGGQYLALFAQAAANYEAAIRGGAMAIQPLQMAQAA